MGSSTFNTCAAVSTVVSGHVDALMVITNRSIVSFGSQSMSPTDGGSIFVSPCWLSFGFCLTRSTDVQTIIFPVPHTILNRTGSAFTGYSVMMWIFGFFWGIVNLCMGYVYVNILANRGQQGPRKANLCLFFSIVFIGLPIYAFLVIMPFFGGWIVTPLVRKVSLALCS